MNKLLGGWAAESRAGKMGGRFPLLPPPPAKGGLAPLHLLQGMLCASLLPNLAGAVCALCLCFVRPRSEVWGSVLAFRGTSWLAAVGFVAEPSGSRRRVSIREQSLMAVGWGVGDGEPLAEPVLQHPSWLFHLG